MSLIYILCEPDAYETARKTGVYYHPSLKAEGFIHASPPNHLTRVANAYYSKALELVVMAVDPSRIRTAVRWEPSSHGEIYPHIYGPLNMDAVTNVTLIAPDASTGQYHITV